MSTTVATQPSIHHPHRRALLSVVVAAALAVGGGAAAGRLTSSDGPSSQVKPAAAPAKNVDVRALWDQLSALPPRERDNIAAALDPVVRARLRATTESIAVAAASR
ncbi:MAG TPA: hypothetical protein VIA11_17930 [Acidimicrobiia bacterium]|jgi:hypothetical protein|nr:hypothetical protein [Acidimicrobiia bacterium]